MKNKIYIGIDPDIDKSGVAVWDKSKKQLELYTMMFFDLFYYLKEFKENEDLDVTVVVEAGWLNKSNWHTKQNMSISANAMIGKRTGENHQVGKKIVEMCEYLKLDYEMVKPKRSKVTAEYFKKITGITKQTNQEKRDAGMLVYDR